MNLITPFDPWNSSLCSCPSKYSLSAYTGCSHGCLYCYASSYIPRFQAVRPKKDFIKRLEREIRKVPPRSLVAMASSSDPYLDIEKELKLTRQALSTLLKHDMKINLVTKSSLIVRDIDLFKGTRNVVASISLTTLDEKLNQMLEPGASTPGQRLKAVKQLSKYIPVAVRFDPLIYPLNTDEIKRVVKTAKVNGARQIITSTYKVRPDNFKRMKKVFRQHTALWNELYEEKGEKKAGYIYLAEKIRKQLIQQVRESALENSLEFSSCREGYAGLNTAHCDGSSLFSL